MPPSALATIAGGTAGGTGSGIMVRSSIASQPRPPPDPAETTNSIAAARRSVRSWVGPQANSICLRRTRRVVQAPGATKSSSRCHQTLAPVASTSLTSRALAPPWPRSAEAKLEILRQLERQIAVEDGIARSAAEIVVERQAALERRGARPLRRPKLAARQAARPAEIVEQARLLGGPGPTRQGQRSGRARPPKPHPLTLPASRPWR